MAFKNICGAIAKECGKAVLKVGSETINKTIEVSQNAIEHTKETIELKREAEIIVKNAKKMYDDSMQKLTIEQNIAKEYIEEFGRLKIDIANNEIKRFEELAKKCAQEQSWRKYNNEFEECKMDNFAKILAPEMALALGKGIAIGAASGLTACTSVALFGSASTGTAISALHGVAATKATLAFLGGGALSAGGAGMAGGMVVLGSVFALPVLLASGFAIDTGLRKKYEKACIYSKKVKNSVAQIETITNNTREVINITQKYMQETLLLRGAVQAVLDCSEEEYQNVNQNEIKAAFQFVTLFSNLFDTPIINMETGAICLGLDKTLEEHKRNFKQAINDWSNAVQHLLERKVELEQELANKEAQILELIEKAEKSGPEIPYAKMKQALKDEYQFLEENSLQFLTTAVLMFEKFEKILKDKPDFSLCIVSCCKVIENELVYLLQVPKMSPLKDKIEYVEKNKIRPIFDFIDDLQKLRKARNGNAHTSIASHADCVVVKTLIFGDDRKQGLLKMVEIAKKRKSLS